MERSLWSDWKLPHKYLDPCFHAESPSTWVPTVSTPTNVWSDDNFARYKTLLTHCFFSSSALASSCLMVRFVIVFSSNCLFSPSEDGVYKIEKNSHFQRTHRFHSLSFSCLSGQRVCSYLAFLCSWQKLLHYKQYLILICYSYDSLVVLHGHRQYLKVMKRIFKICNNKTTIAYKDLVTICNSFVYIPMGRNKMF